MYRLTLATIAIFVGVASVARIAADEPKPAPAPVSCELQVKLSQPMRITVNTARGVKAYWYLLYTVTNNTGREVPFMPEIVRVNEIESELPAEEAEAQPDKAARVTVDSSIVGLSSSVFAAIQRQHAKTHPFLIKPVDAIGTLLQGRDNARSSVAVFKDLDLRVSKFTVYFGGLSGETVRRRNPTYDASKVVRTGVSAVESPTIEAKKYFVLRKTLAVPYTLPGDVNTRRRAEPVLGRMSWIMR